MSKKSSFILLAFASEQATVRLVVYNYRHFYLGYKSLPCTTGQLAGELVTRWSGMASYTCLLVGSCQLECLILLWVVCHLPVGWLARCHAGLKVTSPERENISVGDIQVSPCVMCANVLLLKANPVAKPEVRVGGSYHGHGLWDLFQSFSAHTLLLFPLLPLWKKKCLLTF